MIRAIVDASPVGYGQVQSSARTGVFRVAAKLIDGLRASSECDVEFWFRGLSYVGHGVEEYLALSDAGRLPRLLTSRWLSAVGKRTAAAGMTWDAVDGMRGDQQLRRQLLKYYLRCDTAATTVFQAACPSFVKAVSRADIFHSPLGRMPAVVRAFRHVQKFITVYDIIPLLWPKFAAPGFARFLQDIIRSIRPDDWVFAISEHVKNDLCNHCGIDANRIRVTPLAADTSLFYPCDDAEQRAAARMKYGIPEGPFLLSVGTMQPRKNMDHLIRCFGRLIEQEHISDLSLVLVGGKGWSTEGIFGALGSESLRSRVIFTGYVPDEDLAPLYSGAAAFVFPSLCEGFGLPPLEAMQCGIPVISSNATSLPEVVGDAGVLVDPTDADALCAAILRVYRDSAYRQDLSQRSLGQARLFTWNRYINETLAGYKVALA